MKPKPAVMMIYWDHVDWIVALVAWLHRREQEENQDGN